MPSNNKTDNSSRGKRLLKRLRNAVRKSSTSILKSPLKIVKKLRKMSQKGEDEQGNPSATLKGMMKQIDTMQIEQLTKSMNEMRDAAAFKSNKITELETKTQTAIIKNKIKILKKQIKGNKKMQNYVQKKLMMDIAQKPEFSKEEIPDKKKREEAINNEIKTLIKDAARRQQQAKDARSCVQSTAIYDLEPLDDLDLDTIEEEPSRSDARLDSQESSDSSWVAVQCENGNGDASGDVEETASAEQRRRLAGEHTSEIACSILLFFLLFFVAFKCFFRRARKTNNDRSNTSVQCDRSSSVHAEAPEWV